MNTTIQFLRDPKYQDTVVLFVLAPAGMQFDSTEVGKNLFGTDSWTHEPLLIDGLAPKSTFRYSDISFHWTDFLDLAFRHVDHTLFYIPHKNTLKEIGKESLIQQNPDLYSFSFHKFHCEARKGIVHSQTEDPHFADIARARERLAKAPAGETFTRVKEPVRATPPAGKKKDMRSAADKLIETRSTLHALLDTGWSANAISKTTGITAMTISSIRNGKSSQVSTRVHTAIVKMKADADAGRIAPKQRRAAGVNTPAASAAEAPAARNTPTTADAAKNAEQGSDKGGLLKSHYVAVDSAKLEALIDRLSNMFVDAISDLREIRRQISQ